MTNAIILRHRAGHGKVNRERAWKKWSRDYNQKTDRPKNELFSELDSSKGVLDDLYRGRPRQANGQGGEPVSRAIKCSGRSEHDDYQNLYKQLLVVAL